MQIELDKFIGDKLAGASCGKDFSKLVMFREDKSQLQADRDKKPKIVSITWSFKTNIDDKGRKALVDNMQSTAQDLVKMDIASICNSLTDL